MDYTNLVDKKYGKLTIIGLCKIIRKNTIQGVICKCDCGNECNISVYAVLNGNTTSCGCNYRLQLVGNRFGILTVVERVVNGVNKNKFKCLCDCGNERIIVAGELNRGNHKSCGCRMGKPVTTKAYRDHPLYDVWKGMKARCYGKNHISYHNYGGKGVTVCKEWFDNFKPFYDWAIENGWGQGLHIDKDIIPEKLGVPALLYSPEMCSIVTPAVNSRHSESTKINMVIANEIRASNLTAKRLSELYNISKSTIYRVKANKLWKQI